MAVRPCHECASHVYRHETTKGAQQVKISSSKVADPASIQTYNELLVCTMNMMQLAVCKVELYMTGDAAPCL
jgi:hypothetical protein